MRELFVQSRKIFSSPWFYLSTLLTIILLFCAEIYSDPSTLNRYSVINSLMTFDRDEMLRTAEFCGYNVIRSARSGWFTLFAPLSTAFCFVPLMCAERENNAVRFQVFRSSKMKYELSRYVSGTLSGGISAALGYAVFAGIVYLLFPDISQYSGLFTEQACGAADFLKPLFGVFLYGTFWTMPAMFSLSVIRNKYIVMCIPFFIKYAAAQTVSMLSQSVYKDLEHINTAAAAFLSAINPNALLTVPEYASSQAGSIIFYAALSAAFLVGYLLLQKAGSDKGA